MQARVIRNSQTFSDRRFIARRACKNSLLYHRLAGPSSVIRFRMYRGA